MNEGPGYEPDRVNRESADQVELFQLGCGIFILVIGALCFLYVAASWNTSYP